jgi:hypothetical protein
MPHLTLVHTASGPTPITNQHGFTSRDLIALNRWMQRSTDHGYRRVVLEDGSGEGGPEEAAYILIYTPGHDWASWGIARGPIGLVIWHCGTGADLGRYETMLEALESLPPVAVKAAPASAPAKPSSTIIGENQIRPTEKPAAAPPRFVLVHSV